MDELSGVQKVRAKLVVALVRDGHGAGEAIDQADLLMEYVLNGTHSPPQSRRMVMEGGPCMVRGVGSGIGGERAAPEH